MFLTPLGVLIAIVAALLVWKAPWRDSPTSIRLWAAGSTANAFLFLALRVPEPSYRDLLEAVVATSVTLSVVAVVVGIWLRRRYGPSPAAKWVLLFSAAALPSFSVAFIWGAWGLVRIIIRAS